MPRLPRGHSPSRAIAAGIGLVPEDRKEQGLVTGLPVRQNISMALLKALSRLGVLSFRTRAEAGRNLCRTLAIKTPTIDQKATFLSGGNQQRVVIAKWLATDPKLLIVDEPTRGVDVGAKAEIHTLLCDLARQGMAIMMISSDLPEVLGDERPGCGDASGPDRRRSAGRRADAGGGHASCHRPGGPSSAGAAVEVAAISAEAGFNSGCRYPISGRGPTDTLAFGALMRRRPIGAEGQVVPR